MREDLLKRLMDVGISVSLSGEGNATASVKEITISSFSKPLLHYGIDMILRRTGEEPDGVGTAMNDTGYWAVYLVKPASRLAQALCPQATPGSSCKSKAGLDHW
jgi:hypothetical protein